MPLCWYLFSLTVGGIKTHALHASSNPNTRIIVSQLHILILLQLLFNGELRTLLAMVPASHEAHIDDDGDDDDLYSHASTRTVM